MKVLPFILTKPENVSLIVQEDSGTLFYDKLHQHNEIQISLIVSGEGTFIIGDFVGDFKPNDIFVIGENLPHVFKVDTAQENNAHMISLFFSKNAYGEDFFQLPEFLHLEPFFKESALGIEVLSHKNELNILFEKIKNNSKYKQFISFLDMLNLIVNAERKNLSSLINLKKYAGDEGKRMRDIFQFTMSNFHRDITLDEIAGIANMTPTAFCRYFKQRTNKTYVNFLIDIRIGHACKLFQKNRDLNITEIAYRSGFNNLANFNRKFKELKGITPSEYRKNIK